MDGYWSHVSIFSWAFREGTVDHEPWSFGEECEEVCRLALRRRYRLIPHLYTLFYLAHTKGSLVVSPTFFADTKDSQLRTNENSFLLGPLLVYASTVSDLGVHQPQHVLPNGTWMSFDFEDSHPDLPALYLRGGSVILYGPAHQHIGESNPNEDLSLLVALDENGKAEGVLFEYDGDGYGYMNGDYLLTTYVAELRSSVVTVSISKTEGLWKRPNRRLHVHILLGEGAMVDAWCTDGEYVQIVMPSENEVSKLVSVNKNNYKIRMEKKYKHQSHSLFQLKFPYMREAGRSSDKLSKVMSDIRRQNKEANLEAFQVDLTSFSSIMRFKESIGQWFLDMCWQSSE